MLPCVDDHILGDLGQEQHRAPCVRTTAAQRPCKMTSRKIGLIIAVTAHAIIFCQISHYIGEKEGVGGRKINRNIYHHDTNPALPSSKQSPFIFNTLISRSQRGLGLHSSAQTDTGEYR